MTSNLMMALLFTLPHEGGYTNHPADPGGATNKGITQRVYDEYRKSKGLIPFDVLSISQNDIHEIYETKYWNPSKAEDMPLTVGVVHFDTAVNLGLGQAAKLLQRVLNVPDDGIIGSVTMAVLDAWDEDVIAKQYIDKREQFYKDLAKNKPQFGVFLKGWLNRCADLRKYIKNI